jgi:hypothetical protein
MLLVAANDNGSHFGHHCRRRTSPISIKHSGHQNISFQLKFIESIIALTAALEKICGRPPAFPAAWIHQIHAAGLSWKCRRFRCLQQLVLTTCFRVFPTRRPDTADVSAM